MLGIFCGQGPKSEIPHTCPLCRRYCASAVAPMETRTSSRRTSIVDAADAGRVPAGSTAETGCAASAPSGAPRRVASRRAGATPRPPTSRDDDQEDHATHGQRDAGHLDQERAEMAVLAEPEVLVQEPFDAPQHHADPSTAPAGTRSGRARRPAFDPALEEDEHDVDEEVLHAWKMGTGRRRPAWPA